MRKERVCAAKAKLRDGCSRVLDGRHRLPSTTAAGTSPRGLSAGELLFPRATPRSGWHKRPPLVGDPSRKVRPLPLPYGGGAPAAGHHHRRPLVRAGVASSGAAAPKLRIDGMWRRGVRLTDHDRDNPNSADGSRSRSRSSIRRGLIWSDGNACSAPRQGGRRQDLTAPTRAAASSCRWPYPNGSAGEGGVRIDMRADAYNRSGGVSARSKTRTYIYPVQATARACVPCFDEPSTSSMAVTCSPKGCGLDNTSSREKSAAGACGRWVRKNETAAQLPSPLASVRRLVDWAARRPLTCPSASPSPGEGPEARYAKKVSAQCWRRWTVVSNAVPYDKLDSVRETFPGPLENAGMITGRGKDLLPNQRGTPVSRSCTPHRRSRMAQQWFGDCGHRAWGTNWFNESLGHVRPIGWATTGRRTGRAVRRVRRARAFSADA